MSRQVCDLRPPCGERIGFKITHLPGGVRVAPAGMPPRGEQMGQTIPVAVYQSDVPFLRCPAVGDIGHDRGEAAVVLFYTTAFVLDLAVIRIRAQRVVRAGIIGRP